LLREPLASLRRADWIVVTRSDQIPPETLDQLQQTIAAAAPQVPVSLVRQEPETLINATGQRQTVDSLKRGRWFGFAAIGNPDNFRTTLQQQSCSLVGFLAFSDHHVFTSQDLGRIQRAANETAADAFVCTGKDLVKVAVDRLGDRPLWAVQTSTQFLANEDGLVAALREATCTRQCPNGNGLPGG
jgi:tetraacyldisaccharide 4'-kinase